MTVSPTTEIAGNNKMRNKAPRVVKPLTNRNVQARSWGMTMLDAKTRAMVGSSRDRDTSTPPSKYWSTTRSAVESAKLARALARLLRRL